MKSDAFFVKGKSHDICQDYAMVTENGIAISDGCSIINKNGIYSKHPNSDIAARLICLAAFEDIEMLSLEFNNAPFNKINYDATLTSVKKNKDNQFEIGRVGDGVVYIEQENERFIYTVKYEPNTPEYISYYIDYVGEELEERANRYWKNPPGIIETKYTLGIDWVQKSLPEHKLVGRYDQEFGNFYNKSILKEFKSVSIFSDGILDIQGPNGKLDVVNAVKALVTFKRTNGEFVLARMKAQLRDWASQGIYPNDDLSMATLIL